MRENEKAKQTFICLFRKLGNDIGTKHYGKSQRKNALFKAADQREKVPKLSRYPFNTLPEIIQVDSTQG